MINQSLEQLAIAHLSLDRLRGHVGAAIARAEGTRAIGIDWYQPQHRMLPQGKQRFAICIFVWRGNRWHRSYKLTGPKGIQGIQVHIDDHAARTGLAPIDRI